MSNPSNAKPTTNASQHEQPYQRKAFQGSLPASLVSHVEPSLFRALNIGGFASAKLAFIRKLPKQSFLPIAKLSTERLPKFRTSFAFFAPLISGALPQQSFPQKLPTQSLSPQSLPRIPPNISHQPCLFRALKIVGFALTLPWQSLSTAKPTTNASQHEQPYQHKAYQGSLPAPHGTIVEC